MANPPVRGAVLVTNIRGKEGKPGPAGTFVAAHAIPVPADETDLDPILSGPPDARVITFKQPRGLPGTGAVPADEATAAYMAASDSALHSATDEAFGPSAILNPETAQADAVAQVAAEQVALGGPGSLTVVDARGNAGVARPAGWQGVVMWLVEAGQLNPTNWQSGDLVARAQEQFNPLSLPGLVGFWDARELNLSDGAQVKSWPNSVPGMPALSGNGDAVMDRDGMKGYPTVVFNGTSGHLTSGVFPDYSGPLTIYAVAASTRPTLNASKFIFDGVDGGGSPLRAALARTTADEWLVARGSNFTVSGADTSPHVFRVEYRGDATASLFVDGIEIGSGTLSNSTSPVKFTLGGRGDGGGSYMHEGPISALVAVRGLVSPADNIALTAWLRERFGF